MVLNGKGMVIWNIRNCEGGNPSLIVSMAQTAGLKNIFIRIADGANDCNVDHNTKIDLAPPVVSAFKKAGIHVWGWHYIYGYHPVEEAQTAIRQVKELELSGYVINPEQEYKLAGRKEQASLFMDLVRKELKVPLALSSFRFPSFHPQLPWKTFLDKCDINMPQVYWEKADNPGSQLQRSFREYEAVLSRPMVPTGPLLKKDGWSAKPLEIIEFMDTAKQMGIQSVNFYAWDFGRTILQPLWEAVSNYAWESSLDSPPSPSTTPADTEMAYLLFKALNIHDPDKVVELYNAGASHVSSSGTVKGLIAIKEWYNQLFSTLPDAKFTILNASVNNQNIQITWQATSSKGQIKKGADTLGLLNQKIVYHYSMFVITNAE